MAFLHLTHAELGLGVDVAAVHRNGIRPVGTRFAREKRYLYQKMEENRRGHVYRAIPHWTISAVRRDFPARQPRFADSAARSDGTDGICERRAALSHEPL